MTKDELTELVRHAGVVGAGGAGFPTHVKLQATDIDTYVINGAECEPLLYVDQTLMLNWASYLIAASKAMSSVMGCKVVFGVKQKHGDCISALQAAGGDVCVLGDYYPAGDEVILLHECVGRIVPEGGLPLHVGAIVNNVETLYNIGRALEGKPVTHSFVQVGGAVLSPGVWSVPLGVEASKLVEAAGGPTIDEPVFVDGGPMMGQYHKDANFPVTKMTKAILVLPSNSAFARYENMPVSVMLRQARVACCQCSECTMVCSRYLIGYDLRPHKIMQAMAYESMRLPEIVQSAMLCSECNLCSGLYACPMHLSPRRVNQVIKGAMRQQGVKPQFEKKAIYPRAERPFRLVPTKRLMSRLGLGTYDVHPPFNGEFVAERVKIPLKQHTGAPSIPVVSLHDEVQEGDLIAKLPDNALGANVHASISGLVEEITSEYIAIRASGL